MSHNVTEDEEIHPDHVAEVSKEVTEREGKVGHAVGEDIEALHKAERRRNR